MPWLSTWWRAVKYGHSLPSVLLCSQHNWPLTPLAIGASWSHHSFLRKVAWGGGAATLTIQLRLASAIIEGTWHYHIWKLQLSKSDRQKAWWRSTFLARFLNPWTDAKLGLGLPLIPAIKTLHKQRRPSGCSERHLTPPIRCRPIIKHLLLKKKEQRKRWLMMLPSEVKNLATFLAGNLNPVFCFHSTHPGALGASLAASGGTSLAQFHFFIAWNAIRVAFFVVTSRTCYKAGSEIPDMSGGDLARISLKAFYPLDVHPRCLGRTLGTLLKLSSLFLPKLDDKAYIHWDKLLKKPSRKLIFRPNLSNTCKL